MTPAEIQKARAIISAATLGPWKHVRDDVALESGIDSPMGYIFHEHMNSAIGMPCFKDQEFIAESRTLLPKALDALEQYKEEYENLCKFTNDFESERDQLGTELAAAKALNVKYREALEQFKLGHEHQPNLPHTRAMGETYGWCDFCQEKVSWGEGIAEQALAAGEEKESK